MPRRAPSEPIQHPRPSQKTPLTGMLFSVTGGVELVLPTYQRDPSDLRTFRFSASTSTASVRAAPFVVITNLTGNLLTLASPAPSGPAMNPQHHTLFWLSMMQVSAYSIP